MAASGKGAGVAFHDRLEQKKAAVNELLALRRTKHLRKKKNPLSPIPLRKSPNTGRVYEAYRVALGSRQNSARKLVSREQVRGLIKGTALEEELTVTYGSNGVEDATEYYIGGSFNEEYDEQDAQTRKSGGGLFLHKLMKERKNKLEAMRQRHSDKEQELLQRRSEIRNAKAQLAYNKGYDNTEDVDSDDQNLKELVDEVKQNIGGLEKEIKQLKRFQTTKKMPKQVFKKPPAIDYEFKPWQEEQVRIASAVVDDIIKNVLDLCVYNEEGLEAKLIEELLNIDNEVWERMHQEEVKEDAVIEIYQEIEEEVSSVIIKKVAQEFSFVNKMIQVAGTDLIINSSYAAVNNKALKETKNPKQDIINDTWCAMANNRMKKRKSVWAHSKGVVSKVIIPQGPLQVVQQQEETIIDEDDSETVTLSYASTPLAQNSFIGVEWENYMKAEYIYWQSNTIESKSPAFNMSKKVAGIKCLSISQNENYVAVGTFHGDIIVYDLTWEPFRPIRCVRFAGKTPEIILKIKWSLDSSRILTLSDTRCLIIWSVAYPSPSSEYDLRNLGIPEDKDGHHKCFQLTALAIIEADSSDFSIIEGPLASSTPQSNFSSPTVPAFFPTLDVTCSQNCIVVGFASGDIVKYDFTRIIASRISGLFDYNPKQHDVNYITGSKSVGKPSKLSNGVEVELFRSHQYSVVEIYFMKNSGDMVSIDIRLNICFWKHNEDQLTGFNWFVPLKKFRLDGAESVMVAKGEEKIVFEDELALKKQKQKGKKRRSKKVIEQERKEVMVELRTLKLSTRRPWHSDDQNLDDNEKQKKKDNKFLTRTYEPLPEEIFDPTADRLFHIVTKQRSTNLLVKYATRLYSVSKHFSKTLIALQPSLDGRKIYFMFLFDKHEPNVKAHITFVSLDLLETDMLQSVVIKLFLNKSELDEVINNKQATFTVSKQYAIPNSEYIYCAIAGKMHAFSTFTGSKVAWCAPDKKSNKDPPSNGLEFPQKLGDVKGKSKIFALCPDGKVTYLITQSTTGQKISDPSSPNMITLTDGASGQLKLVLKNLEVELKKQKESFIGDNENLSTEQKVLNKRYSVRHMPLELYIRMTINAMIDNAVAMATGERMTAEQRTKLWTKDWNGMQDYFHSAG